MTGPMMAVLSVAVLTVLLVLGWRARVAHGRLREARDQALLREANLRTVLDGLAEGLMVLDGDRNVLLINPAACELLGVTEAEALGHPPGAGRVIFLDRDGGVLRDEDLPSVRAAAGHRSDAEVIGVERADGTRRWTRTSSRLLRPDSPKDPSRIVLTVADITGQVTTQLATEAEATQLRHRALHDSLTGLPNRTLLLDRLGRAEQNASRRGSGTGLVVVDLDGFKAVNDTLGHAAGDEVLVQVAVRLRTTLRASDTAARLGGDEFVVLCEDLHPGMADLELGRIADRIHDLLNEPYMTSAGPADVGASLGWAVAQPGQALDIDLVNAADEAMLAEKRRRKGEGAAPRPAVQPTLLLDTDRVAGPAVQHPAPADTADELTVFIVDDDPAMRLLASRILESSPVGLRILGEAPDGASGIEAIVALRPDLVLCDVMMPAVSGPEVVSAVRRTVPDQRFIFWSATTAPELERHEAVLGVPFVLKDRIEELPAALVDAYRRATAGGPRGSAQGSRAAGRS